MPRLVIAFAERIKRGLSRSSWMQKGTPILWKDGGEMEGLQAREGFEASRVEPAGPEK